MKLQRLPVVCSDTVHILGAVSGSFNQRMGKWGRCELRVGIRLQDSTGRTGYV